MTSPATDAAAPSVSRPRRVVAHVELAVVVAVLVAAAHLSVLTIRRDLLGQFTWAWNTRDIVWIVPLGYVTVLAPIGLILGVVSALLPRGLPLRLTALLWGWIASFGVLLLYTRAHSVALCFLALAIGVQLSRMVVARAAVWRRVVTVGSIFAVVCLALVVGVQSWRRVRAVAAARASAPEAAPGAPNVLLLVWDTVRARNLSAYGNPRPTTPVLDALAAQGVLFEHAFSSAPWTLPSHATMMTGQYSSVHGGDWLTPLDTRFRTLAEDFRDQGYETGGFTSNFRATGYPTGLHRGFLRYEDVKVTWREVLFSTTFTQSSVFIGAWIEIVLRHNIRGALRQVLRFDWRPYDTYQTHDGKRGAEVAEQFLDWQRASGERPFFAFLNMMEAHNPDAAPMRTWFEGGLTREARYDGALRYLDLQLDHIVKTLAARGVLENTILVVTSDHGEQFGEHGLRAHGNSLYSILLHVPLVIHAPGRVPANVRVSQSVSLRDLRATILELSRLPVPRTPGVSLSSTWRPGATTPLSEIVAEVSKRFNDRPVNPTFYGNLKAVLDDTLHVSRFADGRVESYAYRDDVDEAHDLAKSDSVVARIAQARLRKAMITHGLRP